MARSGEADRAARRQPRVDQGLPQCVLSEAVAHIDPDLGAAALKMMEKNMSAGLTAAADCLREVRTLE